MSTQRGVWVDPAAIELQAAQLSELFTENANLKAAAELKATNRPFELVMALCVGAFIAGPLLF